MEIKDRMLALILNNKVVSTECEDRCSKEEVQQEMDKLMTEVYWYSLWLIDNLMDYIDKGGSIRSYSEEIKNAMK